jgi:hypothetical protein
LFTLTPPGDAVGHLPLTAWVLLLAGLMAADLLLLSGLPTRVLVLLARVLVRMVMPVLPRLTLMRRHWDPAILGAAPGRVPSGPFRDSALAGS